MMLKKLFLFCHGFQVQSWVQTLSCVMCKADQKLQAGNHLLVLNKLPIVLIRLRIRWQLQQFETDISKDQ